MSLCVLAPPLDNAPAQHKPGVQANMAHGSHCAKEMDGCEQSEALVPGGAGQRLEASRQKAASGLPSRWEGGQKTTGTPLKRSMLFKHCGQCLEANVLLPWVCANGGEPF